MGKLCSSGHSPLFVELFCPTKKVLLVKPDTVAAEAVIYRIFEVSFVSLESYR